jgi:trans-aconitate methyltransferase
MSKPQSQQWDASLYEGRFAFVWNHATSLIDLLDPRPGETILDLGCGTGHLTHQISDRGALVTGLDSAPAMIAQARINYPKLRFILGDAESFTVPEPVDAVFSNAALHWIPRAGEVVARVHAALKPGGRFVAEFGGKGNIAKLLAGVRAEIGSGRNPWYFPSLAEYATLLEVNRFRVVQAFHFDRPTSLEGANALEEWLEMFGAELLAPVPEAERSAVRKRIVERLRAELFKDGTWYADYVRLRVVAVRTP